MWATAGITRRRFLRGAAAAAGLAALRGPARADGKAVPFRLGLVTYNVAAAWDLPTLLKICKATGVSPVELRTSHKHGVEPSLPAGARRDVRKQFADHGVGLWGLGSVCEFHAPDPAVVKKNIAVCRQFTQLAADLGAKGVKVRPNALPKEVPPAQTLEQIGKALTECGQAARDAGVEIWVEVHGGGTSEPAAMKAIMEACGHPAVGVCWNSNAPDVKNGSVAESFRLLRPWLKSCHINDLWGAYPYRELFRLMRETGYDRVTLCEVGKSYPDAAQGEEFLRKYRAKWEELARP